MNILIIEDEIQTAKDLQNSVKRLRPASSVVVADSVESGVEWLSKNVPDLIFSDIELGDGLAFEIFQKTSVQCPVIFCTAYDEYALLAFQNNGIDYLLKPVDDRQLEKSLAKMAMLSKPFEQQNYALLLHKVIQKIEDEIKTYKSSFLVSWREKLIPIRVEDIALFGLQDETTQLFTFDNKQYQIQYTLDHLQTLVDPKRFYRTNRQNLVNYKAIKEIEYFVDRKLLAKLVLPAIEPLIISKAKASDFVRWVENR